MGSRISEAVNPKVSDIDSRRMQAPSTSIFEDFVRRSQPENKNV
jgi:hypothetical protein